MVLGTSRSSQDQYRVKENKEIQVHNRHKWIFSGNANADEDARNIGAVSDLSGTLSHLSKFSCSRHGLRTIPENAGIL